MLLATKQECSDERRRSKILLPDLLGTMTAGLSKRGLRVYIEEGEPRFAAALPLVRVLPNRIAEPLGRALRGAFAMVFLALPLFAASVSTTLAVQVRPEVTLSRQGESTVIVKIRLAPGAQAALWRANNCGDVDTQHYTISRSGTYAIPVSVIPGDTDGDACLVSFDGKSVVSLTSNKPARVELFRADRFGVAE